jgi:hypothetical protein
MQQERLLCLCLLVCICCSTPDSPTVGKSSSLNIGIEDSQIKCLEQDILYPFLKYQPLVLVMPLKVIFLPQKIAEYSSKADFDLWGWLRF